jgi:hypothetical protein
MIKPASKPLDDLTNKLDRLITGPYFSLRNMQDPSSIELRFWGFFDMLDFERAAMRSPRSSALQQAGIQAPTPEPGRLIVKILSIAVALALMICGSAQASAMDIVFDGSFATALAQPAAPAGLTPADLTVVEATRLVAPSTGISELPEPDVFLMMLLGLCLIGYRASRYSDEKFT